MDDLLAYERATGETVADLLTRPDEPISSVIAAFDAYRNACQVVVFTDFTLAEKNEARLWSMHLEGKKYFSTQLRRLRRQSGSKSPDVKTRAFIDLYLKWIRGSVKFYRSHVYKLSTTFGVPELEVVARKVKPDSQSGNFAGDGLAPELREQVLTSCHQTLIYLGDLSRWRASEKLDKNPDHRPAVGFYDLACVIRPTSGMGQHQLAVIALEQRQHLPAIYHLYRSICVAEPHPNAMKNLKMQFDKTNAAWDKGELIERGSPNDPEAPKRALVGWFVRLHSICFKGEEFRGFDELMREVTGQLSAELKLRPLGATLIRMIMVNIAAQHVSIENYKENQTPENENAFYSFLRVNLRIYTTLLDILQDDLFQVTRATSNLEDVELTNKILIPSAHVLPGLRIYSCWLYQNYQLLLGLKSDESLSSSIEGFWKAYGRTLDLVASNFSIWELETYSPVPYMLEEDVITLGFVPLIDPSGGKANKVWNDMSTGQPKPRFSDKSVVLFSEPEEMVCRMYGFLEDGLYFAHDLDESPIKIKANRVFYGNGDEIEQLFMPVTVEKPKQKASTEPTAKPETENKPLSYAKAAANGKAQASKPATPQTRAPAFTQSQSQGTQDAQLSRMVDDLVEDDEAKDPVTPPQQFSTNPAVVHANGVDTAVEATPDFTQASGVGYQHQAPISRPSNKYSSVSSLWPTSPIVPATVSPPGRPFGSLASPPHDVSHTRVGSVNSVRSRGSQNVTDSWSSLEGLPQGTGMVQSHAAHTPQLPGLGTFGDGQHLFGAGRGMWNSAPGARKSFGGMSQDGGYGG
ncbi:hypothetical protein Q7P37_011024 [Cladosporium fusiforme]